MGVMKKIREATGHVPRSRVRWTRDAEPAVRAPVNEAVQSNPRSVLERLDRLTLAGVNKLRQVRPLAALRGGRPQLDASTTKAPN